MVLKTFLTENEIIGLTTYGFGQAVPRTVFMPRPGG